MKQQLVCICICRLSEFVGFHLNPLLISAEFRSYFEKYGKVSFAEVMYARETRKPRGFGFVVFQSEQVADKVCNEGQHVIDGKSVSAKPFYSMTILLFFLSY